MRLVKIGNDVFNLAEFIRFTSDWDSLPGKEKEFIVRAYRSHRGPDTSEFLIIRGDKAAALWAMINVSVDLEADIETKTVFIPEYNPSRRDVPNEIS